jgi:hypothetical protein
MQRRQFPSSNLSRPHNLFSRGRGGLLGQTLALRLINPTLGGGAGTNLLAEKIPVVSSPRALIRAEICVRKSRRRASVARNSLTRSMSLKGVRGISIASSAAK